MSLTLSANSPNGSPGDSNTTKESFLLLDLLEELNNGTTALVEFKSTHKQHINDAGIKHLEIMVKSLGLIYSDGQKQVRKISTIRYLTKSYTHGKRADRKRKVDDPM